ncbi:hypothetical protein COCMIDRAFT_96838, partial [Bipolaris oryzae ATCC 44560]
LATIGTCMSCMATRAVALSVAHWELEYWLGFASLPCRPDLPMSVSPDKCFS